MKKNNFNLKIEYSSYDELKTIFNFMCNLTDLFDSLLSDIDDSLKAMESDKNE